MNFIDQKLKEFNGEFPQKLIRKSLNWGIESDPKSDIKSFLKSSLIELVETIEKDIDNLILDVPLINYEEDDYDAGRLHELSKVKQLLKDIIK